MNDLTLVRNLRDSCTLRSMIHRAFKKSEQLTDEELNDMYLMTLDACEIMDVLATCKISNRTKLEFLVKECNHLIHDDVYVYEEENTYRTARTRQPGYRAFMKGKQLASSVAKKYNAEHNELTNAIKLRHVRSLKDGTVVQLTIRSVPMTNKKIREFEKKRIEAFAMAEIKNLADGAAVHTLPADVLKTISRMITPYNESEDLQHSQLVVEFEVFDIDDAIAYDSSHYESRGRVSQTIEAVDKFYGPDDIRFYDMHSKAQMFYMGTWGRDASWDRCIHLLSLIVSDQPYQQSDELAQMCFDELNTVLRRTTISSDSGTARLAAYGSRNDRAPGLLLMA
jgi:hypothetical protein